MAIDLRKLLFMQQAQNEQNQNNLLSTNMATDGLLGGLMSDPTARLLIGANILGAGVKGSDPFSAITPAVLQTAQIQKALRPKDKRTSLQKNLEAAGFVPGTKEYENAIKLRTLPEGTAQYSSFGKLSNRDKARGSADYAVEGIDLLTNVAKIANRSPEAFGTVGAFKGFAKDLSTEIEGIYKGSTDKAAKFGGIDSKVFNFLGNPDFSGIGAIENAVSIHVARNRNPEGRLLKDMITDAKTDAALQNLGGVQKVREKLPFLLQEFVSTARSRYLQSGKSEEEINQILAPKIKEFEIALTTGSIPKKTPGLIFDKKKNIYRMQ